MNKKLKYLPDIFHNPRSSKEQLAFHKESFWLKRGEQRALELFHQMATRVPAYQSFLTTHKIDLKKINTNADLEKIPSIDKDNYLRKFPLQDLCWDGNLKKNRLTISSTSGSTGEPFYFPREIEQDWQYAALAELYLLTNFHIDKKSTLYIIGFPLGPWIGGIFTYQALKLLAERGNYDLSIITAGVNSKEIIKAVKKLGKEFDQVIIGSYGPFLKDTLDEGIKEGINWSEYNLGFVFSAEVFNEQFRDFVGHTSGLQNIHIQTLNHYGTVDLGTMSYETPIAILARRIALQHPDLFARLFDFAHRLPTFTQYFPELFYFEQVENNLYCSSYSGLPLVRYDLKDHGGVKTFSEVKQLFSDYGIDLLAEAEKAGIADTVWELPFVYVYERSDLSVSFYAFQIYPETIRTALSGDELRKYVTGRFSMQVKFDAEGNQFFEINTELRDGQEQSDELKLKVQKKVKEQLLLENSEYRQTYEIIKEKALPKIVFWPHRHPEYFNPQIKQKWVIK